MKTLLICGTYRAENKSVFYNVTLFGQIKDKPEIQYITFVKGFFTGYTNLIKVCKEKFCDYYKINDYNIITLDSLWNKDQF